MPETSELMKRPSVTSDLVKQRAWEIIEPKVKRYLAHDWNDVEAPHIRKQILDVLSSRGDGYAMARRLECEGWEEDRYLVDLMDDAVAALRDACKELTKQWIEVYGIRPERKVGDKVATTHWYRKGEVATIAKIYEDSAEYAIHYDDQPETSYQVFAYDQVVSVPGT